MLGALEHSLGDTGYFYDDLCFTKQGGRLGGEETTYTRYFGNQTCDDEMKSHKVREHLGTPSPS